jgi:hypothetical protein
VWGEPDPDERERMLERCWSDEGELVDPQGGRFRGRREVSERIAGFGQRFPGARVDVTSGIDAHNGFARYAWTMHAAHGSTILEGMDVAEFNPDGRIARLVMFFGPLPAQS